MTDQHTPSTVLAKALTDPSELFAGPEQVVHDPRFSTAEKRRILERWEIDARLLQIATEENMPGRDGEDGSLLQRVRRSVNELTERSSRSPSAAEPG